MITAQEYRDVIDSNGGHKEYSPKEDNYFIVYDHRISLYCMYCINDRCQAPERIYMTKEVATRVTNHLNAEIIKESYAHKSWKTKSIPSYD